MAVQKLVRLTFEHPQYPIDYSFPSHEEVCHITLLFVPFSFLLFNRNLEMHFLCVCLLALYIFSPRSSEVKNDEEDCKDLKYIFL